MVTSDTLGCPSYWPEGTGAVLIRSGSSAYGGILAADGNQLLGLMQPFVYSEPRSYITQFLIFSLGAIYNLAFYAASGGNGPASIVAYIGPTVVLTIAAPPRRVMKYYSVSFLANASSQSITIKHNCGFYCSEIAYIDSVIITQGLFFLIVSGSCLIDVVHSHQFHRRPYLRHGDHLLLRLRCLR